MRKPITGYHTDEEGHWVAELACGHCQHVRHNPPWMERPWVTTEEGRASFIGFLLECALCEEDAEVRRAEQNEPQHDDGFPDGSP